jgi:hypothetical protein
MKVNDSFRGKAELRGRMRMAGEELLVGVQVRPGAGLDFIHRGGRPQSLERINAVLQRDKAASFTVQTSLGYAPGKASVAIYRTAYLAAFVSLGYRYILSPAVGVVRDAIRHGMSADAPQLNVLTGHLKAATNFAGELPEHVVVRLEGQGFASAIYVGIRLSGIVPYWTFSLLPDEHQDPASVFSDLKAAMDTISKFRLRMSGEGRMVTKWELEPS